MKRIWMIGIILIGFILSGCGLIFGLEKSALSGSKPPKVFIQIGDKQYETTLGTYCWKNKCVDTAGPVELLSGTEPIKVKPGEKISIMTDYQPEPNEIYLIEYSSVQERIIELKYKSFSAPMTQGIYHYSYSVWWKDLLKKNVSNGDASYAFVIEVE